MSDTPPKPRPDLLAQAQVDLDGYLPMHERLQMTWQDFLIWSDVQLEAALTQLRGPA